MTPPDIGFSAALLIAGLVCFVGGMIILQTRWNASGSIPLMILMFALVWWDFTYSMFWANVPAPSPNFWLYITYVGVVVVPAALLVFAMQLSRMDDWLKLPFLIGLCVEPVLVLLLLFTDDYHGLFFAGHQTENIGMIINAGPVYWTNIVYSYSLILIVVIILGRRFFQTTGIYRKQIGVTLVGLLFPWANSIIFVLGLSPFPNADNTPFSFTVAGLAFTYALLRYRLLDILPIARYVLIENMSDGVVVLDTQNRLVDLNPAAQLAIGAGAPQIGARVEDVFAGWPNLIEAFLEVKDIRTDLTFGDPPESYLDLKIAPLYDHRGNFLGRLIVWRDITPLKKAQLELQEQAIRDPLTGLFNRRYLNETIERELARARRAKYPLCLALMDIDHFKVLNDTYGHDMGDTVLRSFARQLLSHARVDDIMIRYGGEEFLAILPNVTSEAACQITERWRTSFQDVQLEDGIVKIRSTLSCGIVEFPTNGETSVDLIALADKALYHAKDMGRDRVSVWHNGAPRRA